MKVSFDLKNEKAENQKAVSFKGCKFVKSDNGFRELEVAYPYDENKDNCFIEIYKLDKDQHGNYFSTGKAYSRSGKERYQLKPGANRIDLASEFGIGDNQTFAYHYLLIDKKGGFPRTRVDSGDIIDERSAENEYRNLFNIVPATKSNLSRGGAMKLVIIDSQKVGYVYNDHNMIVKDKALEKRGREGIKTIANKFGGTLAGLEYAVDKGEYDKYGRIISLPIFTDDDFSAHAYWNKNCFQMASSLGNINNYASLQRKMFAHGLNFVSDGAFVNEGLEGVHFKNILRWGEDSPYFNWFRASGLKDSPLTMGVFAKNKDHISHKVVNSPKLYQQDGTGQISIKSNPKYNPKLPTYIQFFDVRLVTEQERSDTTSLIKTYSKMSTDNVYELHSHNDSIYPYAFEINPDTYTKNIKNLNAYNRANPEEMIYLKTPLAARILSKFENFVVDGKFESGFETWDANPDIAKLSFVCSNADIKALKNLPIDERKAEMAKILRGNYQVQDYAISSGQYWTQKTDDILRLYVAQNLKYLDSDNPNLVYEKITGNSNNKIFPESVKAEVSKAEVENVLQGLYNGKRKLSDEDKNSQILEGVMNMPLDSIEFGDNLVSVLASPMITKRAAVKSEIGVPRYEIFKKGNPNLYVDYQKTYKEMDDIYTNQIAGFANTVLKNVDSVLPEKNKLFDGDNVTEYGKYVLPLVLPEITKYAVIKAFAPDIEAAIDKNSGEMSYDYKALKKVSLQTLGINNPSSPLDETEMVLASLRKGLKTVDSSINGEIVESIVRSLKDTSLASFELADLIVDKTQSGLDWRIDATKDIADVEALRNGMASFEYTWQNVIDFWKLFVQGVQDKNPNAYTVAEVTNEGELHAAGYGSHSAKFPKHSDIVPKFLRETGMTSVAEYSRFFRDISKIFMKDVEDGKHYTNPKDLEKLPFEKMVGDNAFIRLGGADSVAFAYTFIGNHDKPRVLHCAALDMELFYSDLTYKNNGQYRRKAYQVIKDKFLEPISDYEVEQYDFSAVSPKAIAMADALRPAFIDVLNSYKSQFPNDLNNPAIYNKAFIPISKAISDLAQGKFQGKRFDPDAFGMKPIDVAIDMVLKQANSEYGFSLPGDAEAGYANDVFEATMKPALSKLLGMMKYLVALPGIPTLFDGDDVGATGYDSKTKNMYLQGRQRVHDEWIDSNSAKYKSFISKYKKLFDDEMAIRRNPKCNALNNGAVFTLPMNKTQNGVLVSSILRQSTDGRMAISIFNPTGMHVDHRREYCQNNLYLDRLYFTESGDSTVGIAGLREGTKFVNARNENDVYYSRIDENGFYYLTRHCNGKDVPMPIDDTTIVLYHVPEGGVSLTFTGSNMVKPNSRFVAGAYQNKSVECGKNLAVVK